MVDRADDNAPLEVQPLSGLGDGGLPSLGLDDDEAWPDLDELDSMLQSSAPVALTPPQPQSALTAAAVPAPIPTAIPAPIPAAIDVARSVVAEATSGGTEAAPSQSEPALGAATTSQGWDSQPTEPDLRTLPYENSSADEHVPTDLMMPVIPARVPSDVAPTDPVQPVLQATEPVGEAAPIVSLTEPSTASPQTTAPPAYPALPPEERPAFNQPPEFQAPQLQPQLDSSQVQDQPLTESASVDPMHFSAPPRQLHVHAATVVVQPEHTSAGFSEAAYLQPSQQHATPLSVEMARYLERLLYAQPGPGGIGITEARAAAVEVGRVSDVVLNAQVIEFGGPETGPAAVKMLAESTSLPIAICDAMARWPDRPIMMIGDTGTGKSHTVAALAGALAAHHLGRHDPDNIFTSLANRMGLPVPFPVVVDMASVATSGPTRPSDMLSLLIRQGELPSDVLVHHGPAVMVVDNLGLAIELGAPGFAPMDLMAQTLRERPEWRVLATTRPVSGDLFFSWGEHHGPFPVIEILPLGTTEVGAMLQAWCGAASPHPQDPAWVRDILPPAVSGCPRLLQLLLGQWLTVATRLESVAAQGGLSSFFRLIIDGVCEHAAMGPSQVDPRPDLQLLADVSGGIRGNAIRLSDIQQLSADGFISDDLDHLLSTGVVEVRMARGDRPAGVLTFTHPMFQEVLLAEFVEEQIIQLGLRHSLDALLDGLNPHAQLAPYHRGQVFRLVEVAELLVGGLQIHLRPQLLESLESWLWTQLTTAEPSPSAHYPRLLCAGWLLADALRRARTPPSPNSYRLVEQGLPRLQSLCEERGEHALKMALGM